MGVPGGDGGLPEERELARTFDRYRHDRRRRRAWSAANPGNVAIRQELARAALGVLAARDPGGLLLDAGCGSGWWLDRLRGAGYPDGRLVGVDLLGERVIAARGRLPGVRIESGDVRALALADGSCALVTLFSVLSSLPSGADVQTALAQARRVLAPGGAIVIWEPRVITPNPATRLIRRAELRRGLGPSLRLQSITVAPPIARRAGRLYATLAQVAPLRSHRLAVARPG